MKRRWLEAVRSEEKGIRRSEVFILGTYFPRFFLLPLLLVIP